MKKNKKTYRERIERPADLLKQPFQDLLRLADRLLFRALRRLVHGSTERSAPERPQRILLIRRNRLGDAICVLPLIERLKANYPQARIAVVGNAYNAPVLRLAAAIDDVYELPERHWGNRWFLFAHPVMRAIRRQRFDVTVTASLTPSSHAARIALYSGGRFRIGPVSGKGSLYDLVFHRGVPVPALATTHQVERVAEMAERAGLRVGGQLPPARLGGTRPAPGMQPRVCLCPDVNRRASAWPPASYAALVDLLRQRHPDWRITVLLPRAAGPYAALAEREDGCLVVTPTFEAFVNELRQASLVVCPEGGTSHLAPALGVPAVVLSGVSIERSWAPWSPLAEVVERTGAVAQITAEEVALRLEALHARHASGAEPGLAHA